MTGTRATIAEHFNENANLYTIFGIFNGLTLYASGLKSDVGDFLSVCFIFLNVFLWLIIRSKIPKTRQIAFAIFLVVSDWILVALVFLFLSIKSAQIEVFQFFLLGLILLLLFGDGLKYFLIKTSHRRRLVRSQSILHALVFFVVIITSAFIIMIAKRALSLFEINVNSKTLFDYSAYVFGAHLMRFTFSRRNT